MLIISVKNLKRLEDIKVEIQRAAERVSNSLHTGYVSLLTAQKRARYNRARFYILQRTKIYNEFAYISNKIKAELDKAQVKWQAEDDKLKAKADKLMEEANKGL